jgi:hypothetical protein
MVGEGRPSTSLPAKSERFPDLPQALRLQSKNVDHGGRGGIPEITERKGPLSLHSHFSVHLLGQLRVLSVKRLVFDQIATAKAYIGSRVGKLVDGRPSPTMTEEGVVLPGRKPNSRDKQAG